MQLYVEQGYDATTVAEIAERAGLTERTFFRHFADKREVLFSGSGQLAELLAQEVARAPKVTPPIDAVGAALEAAGALIQERGEWSKQRQSATLTAEAGVAAFKVAFTKWVEQPTKRNLPRLIRQTLDDLRTITARR